MAIYDMLDLKTKCRGLKCTIVITLCPSLTFHIFDFSSETAERDSTTLDRKQDFKILYQVCVFGPIGKSKCQPWPLIGRYIFDFSSETTKRNSITLVWKQDDNFLYRVCVFRADRKIKKAVPASDWLTQF